ncbi:hypothetical protein PIB30_064540 [Stylosanthes scabra]|uniref:Uncharacterized protein n=1 Tax=Stylosanthes scabra TaxID=79078 RepID=A0ABU6VKR1_9FABA|nr:hypothetical protein [Stylosanthes scabra]
MKLAVSEGFQEDSVMYWLELITVNLEFGLRVINRSVKDEVYKPSSDGYEENSDRDGGERVQTASSDELSGATGEVEGNNKSAKKKATSRKWAWIRYACCL